MINISSHFVYLNSVTTDSVTTELVLTFFHNHNLIRQTAHHRNLSQNMIDRHKHLHALHKADIALPGKCRDKLLQLSAIFHAPGESHIICHASSSISSL